MDSERLAGSLDALGTGAVDLPERQRTLRATVDWSVDLLEEAERSLLEVAAVFVDGWTLPAAAQVAGGLGLADDPGSVLARLVDASMIDSVFTDRTRSTWAVMQTAVAERWLRPRSTSWS